MKIKFNNNALFFLKGRTHEAKRNDSFSFDICYDIEGEEENIITITETMLNRWLKNGYIEEVKEVSYAFEDMKLEYPTYAIEGELLPTTAKEFKQLQAYSQLTHARAKILKDFNLENYDYKVNTFYTVIIDSAGQIRPVQCLSNEVYGLELRFPTKETAKLALQHNWELFKTYLGV